MQTKATMRRGGRRMVTVRFTAHLTPEQLAVLFWKGFYEWEIKQARSQVSAPLVRKAVADQLGEQGQSSSYEVENEDDWEFEGGLDWALDQVMRVYGFTEDDLADEDRARRAARETEA